MCVCVYTHTHTYTHIICICMCMFFLPLKEVVMWALDLTWFSFLTCFLSGLLELWKAFFTSFGYNNTMLKPLKVSSRLRLPRVLRSTNPI